MKPDDLLDYTLGQLEGQDLLTFERLMDDDPRLKANVSQLGRSLDLLLDDGSNFELPASLRERTLALVEAHEEVPKSAVIDFAPPARSTLRWTDLAVAAGILMAGMMILFPAVKSQREQMNQANCASNLYSQGVSLVKYASRHDHYPDVVGQGSELPANYARALQDESLLDDARTLHCPCNGECPEGSELDPKHMDFAYNVGYRDDKSGKTEPISPWLSAVVPTLADQPPHTGGLIHPVGNSPNHGERGQNVLFSDLHLQFLPTRRLGPQDPDIFLNDNHQQGPGLSVLDSSLMPASARIGLTR